MASANLGKAVGKRVAIIAGLRTPFVKTGTALQKLSARELGTAVVSELLVRSGVSTGDIDRVVFGQVVPDLTALNIAREIVLDTGMSRNTDAHSVSRACTTSYQTTIDIAQAIALGDIDIGIAGGADSASDVPIIASKPLAAALVKLSRARSMGDRLRAFSGLRPRDLAPVPPALIERTTGLTMGESAEQMASENGITREAQDDYAHRSHTLAAAAWADGRFEQEVMPISVGEKTCRKDNMVRRDSQRDSYAKLRPIFGDDAGTITAGNSSALTDGASAIVMMSEDRATALGLAPLGYIRSYALTAVDPRGQMLIGPAYSTPIALDRAGLALSDIDLIDVHEAFAAQVLSVTQAFESKTWAARELGRSEPLGTINWDTFNVMGGSIAIGHPFAATGTRQITQLLRELKRRGGGIGLATACAAGGLGATIIFDVQ